MHFECSHTWEDGLTDTWNGHIDSLIKYGNYCEIFISSRSSIHLIFGKYSNGIFAVSHYHLQESFKNNLAIVTENEIRSCIEKINSV